MHALKRFVESYLGLPPNDPGQGTAWNFLWNSPWPAWLPSWAVLLVIVLAVVFIVGVYRRDAATVPTRVRWGLIALRMGVVLMALFFLCELRLAVDRTGLPTVVLLIDDSLSMGFEDDYTDETIQQAASELQKATNLTESTRLNLAKALLTSDEGELLKDLLNRHKVRVYRFSDDAIVLGEGGELLNASDVDRLLPILQGLQPDGEATRPGPAVRKVLDDLRGTPPSAIVVFSDGITTTNPADSLASITDVVRNRLVPVFTVGLGTEEPARDLQVYGLLSDDIAFVDDPVTFSVKLKAFGFQGESVQVVLKRNDTGDEVGRKTVTAGEDGVSEKVEFLWTPKQEGEFEFVAETAVLDDETNTNNNRSQPQTVSVRQEPIRVLLADSVPRYEFRYLKALLEREAYREQGRKTLEVSTVLQQADLDFTAEDRTALDHFPVQRDELFRYDVILIGDIDPSTLSPIVLKNLQDYVRDAGGGLVLMAGPRHNPMTFQGTPLETLLPVDLENASYPPKGIPIPNGFHPELTIEGRTSNAVFRFEDTEPESLKVWSDLPDWYWYVRTPLLKPGAVVFVNHPFQNGEDGLLPLISMQQYGAGKVLFHATDEIWRWRFRRGDLYYGRYWLQAIRYLTRSKLVGQDRGARLTADREQYQRGETVTLRLRFLDERLIPPAADGVTVMVERRGDVQRTVALNRVPQAANVFEGQLNDVGEGSYHVWVSRPTFTETPPADDFVVESQSRELIQRNLDRDDLVQIAKASGGRFLSLAEARRLSRIIPPGQPVPLESQEPILLWNRWEFLLLFTMLLATEWIWRKRWRLV